MESFPPRCSGTRLGWTLRRHPQRSLGYLWLRPPLPSSQPDSEQASALSAQLRSSCRLSCPLPCCRLFEYLIIPFAFPERAQRNLHSHWYRRWAVRPWLTVLPFQEHSQLKTTDGSGLRLCQTEEAMQVVSGTRQQL